MMLKASTQLATQHTLSEEDITISKQPEELAVTTQMHSGGHVNNCNTQQCCKNDGGYWQYWSNKCWIPSDKGTGDWD